MDDFRQKILDDEIHSVVSFMKAIRVANTRAHWSNRTARRRVFRRFAVFDDGCEPARLAVGALRSFAGAGTLFRCGPAARTKPDPELPPPPERLSRAAALLFADCRRAPEDPVGWLDEARTFLGTVAGDRRSFACVCVLLPEVPVLPGGVEQAAEREYDWLLETKPDKTPAERFLLDVENLCREFVRERGANVVLLRAPHVFGPGDRREDGAFVRTLVEKACSSGRVEIGPDDFSEVRSFTAAGDVATAALWTFFNATPGNVFNVPSFHASAADLKRCLHDEFPERFALSVDCPAARTVRYRCLSGLKFSMLRFRGASRPRAAIRKSACHVLGIPYPPTENRAIYSGKLLRIKELELGILREVDRICEKHGLKYFLAAGTLLGAKRYGHNIPWDDDLDIGFLRPDFRKFRKIAEKELPPHLVYCNYFNGTGSQYLVDKIRLRDSWFSTRYSSINRMPDGVFLDILVYDATSDVRWIAWMHNKILGVFQWFIYRILWRHPKRNEFRTFPSWVLYKILCILPIRSWHWLFERWLMLFGWKKRPKYVVDGLGARAGLGLIPAAGLFDTVRIPFDNGFMAPSPADPEDYLRFAYGENWIGEPPLGEQHGHPLARIDLGSYAFSADPPSVPFRHADIRGELFETTPETGTRPGEPS